MPNKNPDLFVNLLLLGVVLIWGGNFSVMKMGLEELNPFLFSALRFLPSSIPVLILGLFLKVDFSLKREDIWPMIGLSILGTTIYQTLFTTALDYTTPGNSSLLMATSPIFAAFITTSMGQERLKFQGVLGIIAAFFGAYLVISSQYGIGIEGDTIKGDLLVLTAAALWAIYCFLARNFLKNHHFMKLIFYTSFFGGLSLLLLFLPQIIEIPFQEIKPRTWSALGYSTFLATSTGLTVWYFGLDRVGTTKTIVFMYLTPVIAGLFSILFHGEVFTLPKILGALVIFFGVHQARKGTLSTALKEKKMG